MSTGRWQRNQRSTARTLLALLAGAYLASLIATAQFAVFLSSRAEPEPKEVGTGLREIPTYCMDAPDLYGCLND